MRCPFVSSIIYIVECNVHQVNLLTKGSQLFLKMQLNFQENHEHLMPNNKFLCLYKYAGFNNCIYVRTYVSCSVLT